MGKWREPSILSNITSEGCRSICSIIGIQVNTPAHCGYSLYRFTAWSWLTVPIAQIQLAIHPAVPDYIFWGDNERKVRDLEHLHFSLLEEVPYGLQINKCQLGTAVQLSSLNLGHMKFKTCLECCIKTEDTWLSPLWNSASVGITW